MGNIELQRYSRQIILPQIGIEGQKKLKKAKILCIGAGGLGCPILQYLGAAGVGTLGIIDFDVISETNLHRQILYRTKDIGLLKVEKAKIFLEELNPYINIKIYNTKITKENAFEIIENYDIIIDGSDNFSTRYLVNDACVLRKKPLVYGSIYRFEGQVSVFNLYDKKEGNYSSNYRDLYPTPPEAGSILNCEEGGVFGVIPGIIGTLQASETIKLITGIGEILKNKLFIIDCLNLSTTIIEIEKDINNPISGKNPLINELIDYELFCNSKKETGVKSIDQKELERWKRAGKKFQLIDVREENEYLMWNLGGLLIPLSKINSQMDKIDISGAVVVHCKSGVRSEKAIKEIKKIKGEIEIYNLGING